MFERPNLRRVIAEIDAAAYRPFMRRTQIADYWDAVYACFPEWQLALLDGRSGGHLAHGNRVPFAWDGTPEDLPMARFGSYIRWSRPDGLPYDPWQRVHQRLGATPVRVIPAWLTVTGTVATTRSHTSGCTTASAPRQAQRPRAERPRESP